MKMNLPISRVEQPFTEGLIVTRTDLNGVITHANDRFVEISGFSREELLGQHHNIVRHPDMPPVLFADLWEKLKADRPWRGYVKNRCKNGDHYWVHAYVVPLRQDGHTTGFMSVRRPATREAIRHAESWHTELRDGKKLLHPRPKGAHEKGVRVVAGSIIAGLIAFGGWRSGDLLGYGLAGTALLTQAGWALFEHLRAKQFSRLREVCNRIANGKLNHELAIHQSGECGELEEALAYMQVSLKVMIDDLQMSARALAKGNSEVSEALADIFKRMETGNINITQMSAAIEQLSASVEQVARHAGDTSQLSSQSRDAIQSGEQEMAKARANGAESVRAVEGAQDTISSLSDAINAIGEVTKTIRDIADQTNLLALNAAIEAARAGDQGRGFAVVADEVRKLAERTSRSTEQITSLVANVHQAAEETIGTMRTITGMTRSGVATQESTAEHLVTVRDMTVRVNDMMREVASTNTQQATAAGELSSRMADMATQIGESHRHVEVANRVIVQLAGQSKRLNELTEQFEVN